jgi:hypothetical protein
LAYSRRRRSPWDRAKDRATDLIDTAREEAKPWMGIAAGTAAAGAALAVLARRNRETGWERAGRRAREIASNAGTQASSPWANLAATAAISLASAAYANRSRRRTIRGVDEGTAEAINSVLRRGAELLRRARNIADETGKIYPRVRRAIG